MLNLMYITNNPEIAKIADFSGVDRIFVDLEIMGKEERQHGLDTVKSNHKIADISDLKAVLIRSKLLVRINPIYDNTEYEIEEVIKSGADLIMLPYFKSLKEVRKFISLVGGRTKTVLLLETKEAVEILDEILAMPGIDEIYIGLNDLHLSYGLDFMFEFLYNGLLEKICNKISVKGIPYGFGGIAGIGQGLLPSEKVIAEHYRLGSGVVILSRTFCKEVSDLKFIKDVFLKGINEIRAYERKINKKNISFFVDNHRDVCTIIEEICE